MPKLLTSTLRSQQDIVRRVENAEPGGVTRRQIAQIAGVDPSMISFWTSEGENGREMPWSAVRKLADAFGWDRVLGEDAAAAGFMLDPGEVGPVADARSGSLDLTVLSAQLAAKINEAATDGRFDSAEGRELLSMLGTASLALDGLKARVATGRVA